MILELGPVPADDLKRWSRFARRVVVELRTRPDVLPDMGDDLLDQWGRLADDWCRAATEAGGGDVRWSAPMDDEQAEYLLHGLERCFYSPGVTAMMAPDEVRAQRQFTLRIVQAFVDGLAAQGEAQGHYVDQLRASFAGHLD